MVSLGAFMKQTGWVNGTQWEAGMGLAFSSLLCCISCTVVLKSVYMYTGGCGCAQTQPASVLFPIRRFYPRLCQVAIE